MGSEANTDPHWLDRWLLPDVAREGLVFEAMLDGVEDRLRTVSSSWQEMKADGDLPQEAADALIDEGASAEALRVDIAEIALTAVFHWVERRCASLLDRKTRGEPWETKQSVAGYDFMKKVKALKARGVDLASLPRFKLINGVLKEFANSWKHRDAPKRELTDALGLQRPAHDLLRDEALRRAMAQEVGLPPDAGVSRIVQAYAFAATDFLQGAYRAAYPRPRRRAP